MNKYTVIIVVGLVLALAALEAVLPRRDEKKNEWETAQPTRVVAILIDKSGSFHQEDKAAFEMTGRICDRLVRNNNSDRVVISQLSGNSTPLVFEGSVLDLRTRFPDADAFAKHMKAVSDPSASRIHAGICDTLEYVLSIPAVASGKASVVTCVMSDLEDTTQNFDPDNDARLKSTLLRYGASAGAMLIYWCEMSRVEKWRTLLRASKVKGEVYGKIVSNPPVPNF